MKKLTLVGVFLIASLLTAGVASAGVSFGFSFPFYVGAPAYYPYPAYGYYGPGVSVYYGPGPYYGPYYGGYRVWVPGYWGRAWTGHGWVRSWHGGHWRHR